MPPKTKTTPKRRAPELSSQPTRPASKVKNWDGGEYVKVNRKQLKFAEYNPRNIDHYAAKGLQESIKSTGGLVETVLWNARTGNVVAGHQRLTQVDALNGGTDYEVTVIKINVDEAEERRLNILLNNPAIQGTYDLVKLFELLGPQADYDIDLGGTGFDVSTLEIMAQDAGMDMPLWLVPAVEQETADDVQEATDDVVEVLDEADAAREQEKEQARIDDFKRKKATFREKAAFDADQGVYLRVVFGTSDERDRFLDGLGLQPDVTYLDARFIAEKCGIEIV